MRNLIQRTVLHVEKVLWRPRFKNRSTIANEIVYTIYCILNIQIQWDGKLVDDLSKSSTEKVDRFAVYGTDLNVMTLLGVPNMKDGTGKSQAEDWTNEKSPKKLNLRVSTQLRLTQVFAMTLVRLLRIRETCTQAPCTETYCFQSFQVNQ